MERRGAASIVHSAIAATATSSAIDMGQFPALYVQVDLGATGTPNWTITVQGCATEGGTYVALTDTANNAMSTGALTADAGWTFIGCPRYTKVVATENSGTGTCTVTVVPISV